MTFKCYLLLLFNLIAVNSENIVMTEVFIIKIEPSMFNWTYEGDPNQFFYQPALKDSPDLPSWMNYHFSERQYAGFLYGVAPENYDPNFLLEIIALDRKTYDTKLIIMSIHIIQKFSPAVNEVHLKIDNLSVEDMFNMEKIKALKDVFAENLWKDSAGDLYVTFLESAVQLGARLPLNPNEGEGVVIRIGSQAHLSPELIKLQAEVKPLWKQPPCPRDFKRTTVERVFRDAGFILDWCVFRLIEDSTSAMEQQSSTNMEDFSNLGDNSFQEDSWKSWAKSDVPERSYASEIALTFLLPSFLFILFALMLTFIMYYQHEAIVDEVSEEFFNEIFHICTDYLSLRTLRSQNLEETPRPDITNYATIHRATQSLRGCSLPKDKSCLSPEMISHSNTESPTSTVRGIHCRPSPPPYVRPKFKPDL